MFLVKITDPKISQEDAFKLYFNLITPDITELEKMKGKGKNKRCNILNVLKNLESVLLVFICITKICHQNRKRVLRREQN